MSQEAYTLLRSAAERRRHSDHRSRTWCASTNCRAGVRVYSIPATRLAEELGKRMVLNIVMVGFFGAITKLSQSRRAAQCRRRLCAASFPRTEPESLRQRIRVRAHGASRGSSGVGGSRVRAGVEDSQAISVSQPLKPSNNPAFAARSVRATTRAVPPLLSRHCRSMLSAQPVNVLPQERPQSRNA